MGRLTPVLLGKYTLITLGEAICLRVPIDRENPLNLNWVMPAKERKYKNMTVFPLASACGEHGFFILT